MLKLTQRLCGAVAPAAKALIGRIRRRLGQRNGSALAPLTPKYQPAQHDIYVRELEAAIENTDRVGVRNIALSGSYGAGKSSVLRELTRRVGKRAVELSLSTLGAGQDASDEDDSTTNRIEKEIVKQLLYTEAPGRMRGSRFQRIQRFSRWRAFQGALLMAVPTSITIYLAGWTGRLVDLMGKGTEVDSVAFFVSYTCIAGLLFLASRHLHDRLRIDKVSAGSATVSLAESSNSYFDQYLDEIVYFFEVTKKDIVILEDIDRFDDPHIFEELRALNQLLNSVSTLGTIRFIYAVRDSIFDELEALEARRKRASNKQAEDDGAEDEVAANLARANRTKFFDLVIPVVPFISHRNARDLMARELAGTKRKVSMELVDLASHHIADMRLIKNVRNEFEIFSTLVLEGQRSRLNLDPSRLFAMMLYKSTHLADFERIRTGRSRIDTVYQASRELVRQQISRCDKESKRLNSRLIALDSLASRVDSLGAELWGFIENRQGQTNAQSLFEDVFSFPGASSMNPVSREEFSSPDFWELFLQQKPGISFQVSRRQYQFQNLKITIPYEDIKHALRLPDSVEVWSEQDRLRLESQLTQLKSDRAYLLQADMQDLCDRPDLTFADETRTGKSLSEVARDACASELAVELIEAGFIDRNFTLYTTTFYEERMSPRAMNFLMHNVDRNQVDMHYALDQSDVVAIVRDRGSSVLKRRAMYNISVADALFGDSSSDVLVLIRALAEFSDSERQFTSAYLSGGKFLAEFAAALAPRCTDFLAFVLDDDALEVVRTIRAFDAALASIDARVTYEASASLRDFISSHLLELETLTKAELAPWRASVIVRYLAGSGVIFNSLAHLSPQIRKAVITAKAYSVTRGNLQLATSADGVPSLDQLKESHIRVYERVLADAGAYLESLHEGEVALQSTQPSVLVVNDLIEHAADDIDALLERTSPDWMLADLNDVGASVWRALAEKGLFALTLENINAYTESGPGWDAALGAYLSSVGEVQADDADNTQKFALAYALLEAGEHIPVAEARVALVKSLELEGQLDVASITLQPGQLAGHLLEAGLIADDRTTFDRLQDANWRTKEFAIQSSSSYSSLVAAGDLGSDDLGHLLKSDGIPREVKDAVMSSLADYLAEASAYSLSVVADRVATQHIQLSLQSALRIASAGNVAKTIAAVEPSLDSFETDAIKQLLGALGEPFDKLDGEQDARPTLADSAGLEPLLNRLKTLGLISSYKPRSNGYKVNSRRK